MFYCFIVVVFLKLLLHIFEAIYTAEATIIYAEDILASNNHLDIVNVRSPLLPMALITVHTVVFHVPIYFHVPHPALGFQWLGKCKHLLGR